ncbi:MAG: hypothetical protein HY434_00345 [Candidatus Liptonbacteria bacterium]|nr:hypothetical protein [Candidatus Liptonbacteria bacterium]
MSTQTLLKNIETKIKKSNSPLVVLSLAEWRQIEDVIRELSSPRLLESIEDARNDYKKGKAVAYQSIRNR